MFSGERSGKQVRAQAPCGCSQEGRGPQHRPFWGRESRLGVSQDSLSSLLSQSQTPGGYWSGWPVGTGFQPEGLMAVV